MTYAPTVAYLRTTALAAGAKSFWHGKQATQSINYDAQFPQAHLFLMPDELDESSVDRRIRMCFYGKDELENGDESIGIIDDMDRLSQAFVRMLRDDEEGIYEVKGSVSRGAVWREGSQIGTGYFITFTLTSSALC